MKLTKERIAWLRGVLEAAEYCHLGAWGDEAVDVQDDLESALDDIAQLKRDLAAEKRKHLDTSNWAMEQQDRADRLEHEVSDGCG